MKVILLQGVKKLGVAGEIKEVANGYVRNFLLPKGFAKLATSKVIAEIEMRAKTKKIRKLKSKKEKNRLVNILQKVSLEIPMKMGTKNKLYGSVTSQIISQALRNKGHEVLDKQIIIPKTIKRLGEHSVNVKLGGGNDVSLKLDVVALLS